MGARGGSVGMVVTLGVGLGVGQGFGPLFRREGLKKRFGSQGWAEAAGGVALTKTVVGRGQAAFHRMAGLGGQPSSSPSAAL